MTAGRHARLAATGLLIAASLLLWREGDLARPGELRMSVFDVGQGDAILLVTPSGRQVLVDGGPDRSALSHLGRAMPFFDRSLDLLVLTHPHLDHLASLPEVLRRYRVERVLLTDAASEAPEYRRLLDALSREGAQLLVPDPATDIDLGDGVVLDVVWPPPGLWESGFSGDVNDTSIVLRALYKDHAILLTGDMEAPTEAAVLASGADVDSDVLKVAHHGSRTSSSTGFLLAVSPSLAVISAGTDNRFGHPHPEIVARFASLGIPLRVTAEDGTLHFAFR